MWSVRSRGLRLFSLLLALAVFLTACNQGMPEQSGEYELKPQSLSWDGQQYKFAWVGADGEVHWASGDDVQLVQDQRTYLEMKDGKPIVHLKADDPVAVLAQDRDGDFTSWWFPFVVGSALGGRDRTVVINEPYPGTRQVPPDRPTYRYPPTDSFGRGDSLHGSVSNDKPASPSYGRVKPIPDAVGGQSGGTGGGSAATTKAPSYSSGQAGGTGTGAAASTKRQDGGLSGVLGGTGTGSAATSKGTFRAGSSTSSAPSSSSGSKLSPSGSGSKITGGKSSGGFSGGKSSSGSRIGGKRR